jgi:peptide/nickel transport system permease protein
MSRYLIRHLFQSLFLVWGVMTGTFLLLQISPGHPTDTYLSPNTPPETIALIRKNFGFDDPLPTQYLNWLKQWSRGNFGYSLAQHRPVEEVLAEAIPPTLQLTVPALFLSFSLGLVIGATAAAKRDRWLDRILSNSAIAVYCVPGFWLALMLILIFSVHLRWLPSSHAASLFTDRMTAWESLVDRLSHSVLPVLTLGITGAAAIARYVRENMVEVLESDFVLVARAKGLSTWQITTRHLLKHASLPLISLFGLSVPFLLGGAFLVEVIFAWPGMGRATFEAIFARDYPVVLATTALSAIMVIGGNLFADLLYTYADPRIKLARAQQISS